MGSERRSSSNRTTSLGWRCLLAIGVTTLVMSSVKGYAAPVRGLLRLDKADENVGAGTQGYWRDLRNPTLPIAPPLLDPRRSMVVAIEGSDLSKTSNIPPLVVLEDGQITPPVLAVRPGTKVSFENRDWQLHLLEPVGTNKFMKAQSIDPGDKLSHVFDKAGTYRLHCSEVPHMHLTVLVSAKAQLALPDNTGTFRFPDIRPGTYQLQVWYRGKWIHTQPLTVRGKTTADVQLPPLDKQTASAPTKKGN